MKPANWIGSLAIGISVSFGCGPAHQANDASAPKPVPSVSAAPSASTTASAAPTPAPKLDRFATLANSGADECKLQRYEFGDAYFLAGFAADMTAGFGLKAGLFAWMGPKNELRMQTLGLDGAPRGKMQSVDVPKNFKPRAVAALDAGFVVIGELYEFSHERYAAVVTDADARALGGSVELELEHRYVQSVSPSKRRKFVIFATRALMVPPENESLRGRWLEVEVDAKGKITQHGAELDLAYPLIRVFDQAYDLEIDGAPAWYVARGNEGGELIRAGKLERTNLEGLAKLGISEASLKPKDRVDFMLSMDAEGSTFSRVADGKVVGKQTPLPAGTVGIINPVIWSGTHWTIPYTAQSQSKSTAAIVALDCKP